MFRKGMPCGARRVEPQLPNFQIMIERPRGVALLLVSDHNVANVAAIQFLHGDRGAVDHDAAAGSGEQPQGIDARLQFCDATCRIAPADEAPHAKGGQAAFDQRMLGREVLQRVGFSAADEAAHALVWRSEEK